jgi:hypothetical protein
MKFLIRIPAYVFLFLVGCSNANLHDNKVAIASIDVNSAKPIDFDDMVDSLTCIKTESVPDAMFNDCWKIRIYNDNIYLYSLTDLSVQILNKSGKYIATINSQSEGKVMYPSDIIINKKEQELWIIDKMQIIKRYNLSGNRYIGSYNLPFKAVAIANFDNNSFLFFDGGFDKKSNKKIALYSPFQNSNPIFFANKNERKIINSKIPATLFADAQDGSTYTLLPKNDTIYYSASKSNGILFKPRFHLDFNENYLTENQWPDEGFSDKAFAEIINSKKYIFNIRSFYYASNKIFFETQGKENLYYALDTKSNQIVKFDRLFDDIRTTTSATSIQGSSGKNLYFIFDADEILKHYQKRNLQSKYSAITRLLKDIKSENKNIIVICTLK